MVSFHQALVGVGVHPFLDHQMEVGVVEVHLQALEVVVVLSSYQEEGVEVVVHHHPS